MFKRYVSYLLIGVLLLVIGDIGAMACDNCSSRGGAVLEVHSQDDLAKVLELVNLSEVQAPSASFGDLLKEIGLDGNGTAYILIPTQYMDPCGVPVPWTCHSANCPSGCDSCFYTGGAWREAFNDCAGLSHVCCPTASHVCGKDKHGCNICRCN